MSISPSHVELSMYTAVLQAQTALGGIMQRGLGIQIDSVKCLEPYPWNKLEIPERLNGEGVTIAIMAQQGGYLLFISDDGILLPAGFRTTLDDPTQPLPIMANQLQKELQPDAPEYVGKRIGKAKVFSSMARRAGVDNTAQILPINLDIGGQESIIWFIGSVPHPERAFAKRTPNSESKSKKTKLFSDEILANFTVSSDIISSTDDSAQPIEETTELLNESSVEINRTERPKADLERLLALKSATVEDNSEWQSAIFMEKKEETDETQNGSLRPPVPSVDELSYSNSTAYHQGESVADPTLASTVQSSLLTPSCPIDVEKDVVIVQGDSISEDIIPEDCNSEDSAPDNTHTENEVQEDVADEDVITNEDASENEDVNDIPDETDLENEVQEDVADEDVIANDVASEEPELPSADDAKQYTVHPAHINYPVAHCVPPISSHPALKMPVSMVAVISHRSCLVQDILSWKPGSVIEFDNIQPTITLESNGVVLGQGKPIEQNKRIGIQLE